MDMDESKPTKKPASCWVIVNSVTVDGNTVATESDGKTDSDAESDGISVISESSHFYESNIDEECVKSELPVQETTSTNETQTQNNFVDEQASSTVEDGGKSTSKWTLLNDEPKSRSPPPKYYLNCFQEPIIEISDNDVDSIHSENSDMLEMETNSNSTLEDDEVENLDLTNNRYTMAVQTALHPQQYELRNLVSNSILIGAIILVISLLLGLFLTEQIDYSSVTQDVNIEDVAPADKYEAYQNLDVIEYCIQKYKNDQGVIGKKINSCVKQLKTKLNRKPNKMHGTDKIRKMDLYLKLKERLLEVKERDLLLREIRLLKAELGVRKRYKNIKAFRFGENSDNGNSINSEILYDQIFNESLATVSSGNIKKNIKTDLKIKGDMDTYAENLKEKSFKFQKKIKRLFSENKNLKPKSKSIKKPVGPEVLTRKNKSQEHNFKVEPSRHLTNKLNLIHKEKPKNDVSFKTEEHIKTITTKNKPLHYKKKNKVRAKENDGFLENKKYKKNLLKDSYKNKPKKEGTENLHKNLKLNKKSEKGKQNKAFKRSNYEEKGEKDFILSKHSNQEKPEKEKKIKHKKHVRNEKKIKKEKIKAFRNKNDFEIKKKYTSEEYLADDIVWFLRHSSPERYFEVIANLTKRSFETVKEGSLNSTLSGQWYMNLHKGRDSIRKREHMADWYFDRSYMRRLQRMDRAKWYFDWMSSRNKVRYTF